MYMTTKAIIALHFSYLFSSKHLLILVIKPSISISKKSLRNLKIGFKYYKYVLDKKTEYILTMSCIYA